MQNNRRSDTPEPASIRLYSRAFLAGAIIAGSVAVAVGAVSFIGGLVVDRPSVSAEGIGLVSAQGADQVGAREDSLGRAVASAQVKSTISSITAQDGGPGVGRTVEVQGQCTELGLNESMWLTVRTASVGPGLYPVADLSSCRSGQGVLITSCTGEPRHAGQRIDVDTAGSGWTARHCLGDAAGAGQTFDLQLLRGSSTAFVGVADHFEHGDSSNPVPVDEEPDIEPFYEVRITRDR